MKHCFFILFTTVSVLSFGQNHNFYLRAGFNLSSLTSGEFSITPGYHLGIGGERIFNEKLSMLHELIFTQQGAFEDPIDAVVRIHYLQFPLLLKVRLEDKSYFVVGPQLGIVISGDIPKYDEPLTAALRPLDISLNAGLGYNVSTQWALALRLNAGVTDVTVVEGSNPRNMALQLSAILKLNKNDDGNE